MTGLLVLTIVIVLIWIEVIVFGIVGGAIGVLPTLIGVFVSAILGFQLIRFNMMRIVSSGAIGKPPHEIMPQVLLCCYWRYFSDHSWLCHGCYWDDLLYSRFQSDNRASSVSSFSRC